MAAILVFYAFLSNVALAVVPHEPVVIWYGSRLGVWSTGALATAGTVAAGWADYRLFARAIARRARSRPPSGWGARLLRGFDRCPFAVIALSALAPLPFFPIKVAAFATGYPLRRFLAAVALGRLPRYLLLAGLGVSVRLPPWALVAAGIPLTLIALGGLPWRPRTVN